MSQQINLFNPIFRRQKKYFSSVTMLQALSIIALGCLLLAGDAARRGRVLTLQAASADARLQAREQLLAETRVRYAPRAKQAALVAELDVASETLTMLRQAAATIEQGGLGDTRGFSVYFRAFARQRVDGLWLTRLDIGAGGERIGVQGNTLQAELVPLYMRRLASEPVMQGKAFSTLEMGPALAAPGAAAAPERVAGAPTYLRFKLQSSGPAVPVSLAAK